MAGKGDAEETDVFETEADDAEIGLAVVEVWFGAGRCEARDDFGGDWEVEQEQIAPGGGEDGALRHAGDACEDVGPNSCEFNYAVVGQVLRIQLRLRAAVRLTGYWG